MKLGSFFFLLTPLAFTSDSKNSAGKTRKKKSTSKSMTAGHGFIPCAREQQKQQKAVKKTIINTITEKVRESK